MTADGPIAIAADDDARCRALLVRMLGARFARVAAASDGAEALGLLEAHGAAVALLVTDRQMPRLDGLALIERLRARGCQVPAVLISAFLAPAHRERAARAGAVALDKPFGLQAFRAAVADALAAGRSGRLVEEDAAQVRPQGWPRPGR